MCSIGGGGGGGGGGGDDCKQPLPTIITIKPTGRIPPTFDACTPRVWLFSPGLVFGVDFACAEEHLDHLLVVARGGDVQRRVEGDSAVPEHVRGTCAIQKKEKEEEEEEEEEKERTKRRSGRRKKKIIAPGEEDAHEIIVRGV